MSAEPREGRWNASSVTEVLQRAGKCYSFTEARPVLQRAGKCYSVTEVFQRAGQCYSVTVLVQARVQMEVCVMGPTSGSLYM